MNRWYERPYSLVSLYDMLQYAAHHFVDVMGLLNRAETLIHIATAQWGNPSVQQFQNELVNQVNEIDGVLATLTDECAALDLAVTALSIKDFRVRLRTMDMSACGTALREVRRLVGFELQTGTFFYIPQEKIRYFNEPRELFGKLTLDKFPSVISEVEEAGKCYAAGRNTASVFHLLRIMEAGLKIVAQTLSIATDTNRSWDSLLRKITSADHVQHPRDEWTEFYTDIGARLHTVKDAWRNPTMHIERSYVAEEALDIFNGVSSFMRHLATRLRE
jgi:hypothetical protein